jgi:SAM-dependent methyltransferase
MMSPSSRVFATSNPMQISFVLDVIVQLHPGSVLDIGCGSGKYGVLAREYLRAARIDGIEGFAKYITDVHRATYDNVLEGNALEIVPKLQAQYDVAMMIDMFEHLTPEQGRSILRDLETRAKNVLVSVPVHHPEQDAMDGNVLQQHHAQYDVRSLRQLGFTRIWRISGNYIALKGPGKVNLKLKVLKSAAACLLPHWVSRCIAPVSRKLMRTQQ